MNRPDRRLTRSRYLEEVGSLLGDVDSEERSGLLADLGERLDEISEAEIGSRLGSPKDFVDEYRRSAGFEPTEDGGTRTATVVQNVLSGLLLPFGALVLLSFGGQILFGPFVLAIEWILARISLRPLRIAWSILAGALVGEIVFLVSDTFRGTVLHGLVAVLAGSVSGWLVYRTSRVTP